jgi:hypothetical protein
MIEREPDFEDEKIRAWSAKPEDRKVKRDPTLLPLDVEKEEIFESRVYHFRPSSTALFYLIELFASQHPEAKKLDPKEIASVATELMEEISFKFLAKRRKEDGAITSLLVVAASDRRSLLAHLDQVAESEYRQVVEIFEESFLTERGILAPPLVVTLEEWRRYSQKGPFTKERPE